MLVWTKPATVSGLAVCALLTITAVSPAAADVIPYPNPGIENPATYTFSATSTGTVTAYFYGSNASYNETLGLLVNGADTGITGLQNHTSSVGDSLSFGSVNAGDVLTFYIDVNDPYLGSTLYYSDKSKNTDNENHVYASTFSGTGTIPSGTYVGFEDLSTTNGGNPDYNYTDEQFVFTNAGLSTSPVPLPASAPMFGAALLALGVVGYGVKRKAKAG